MVITVLVGSLCFFIGFLLGLIPRTNWTVPRDEDQYYLWDIPEDEENEENP